MIWGVIGELREPSSRSGVIWPNPDGIDEASLYELEAYWASKFAWDARRDERAAALTTDHTHGGDAA